MPNLLWIKSCTRPEYYSIILDMNHIEQLSVTVRFVDLTKHKIGARERFLGYEAFSGSTGENLLQTLLETLGKHGLRFEDCRGQGHDNGANMVGRYKGVLSRFLGTNSREVFVPCGCHSLNLVISDAARSSRASLTLFGVIQRIFTVFSASTQRWKILKHRLPNLTLNPLCTTRWESRIDSVKAVLYQTKGVRDTLINVTETPQADPGLRSEAVSLAKHVFRFLVSLRIWQDILFQVNIVSKSMQRRSTNIADATSLLESCTNFMVLYEESGFAAALMVAKETAEGTGIDACFREPSCRRRKRKKFFDDDRDFTAEDSFRTTVFSPIVKVVKNSIDERFEQLRNHSKL